MPASALTRRWLDVQEWGLARVDTLGNRLRPATPPHLAVGLRGERAALFHLRRLGYTVVAQRWTSAKVRGDLDMIAWQDVGDGQPWLCFIEVKTRSARDLSPAESAIDRDKQRTLRGLAHAYLRVFPEEKRRRIPVRFDVVSVYLLESGPEFDLFQGAFPWG